MLEESLNGRAGRTLEGTYYPVIQSAECIAMRKAASFAFSELRCASFSRKSNDGLMVVAGKSSIITVEKRAHCRK